MAEIFIEEWRKKDLDGRRNLSTRSKEKINGEYAYGCVGLTSWFRLGKYIIKHDQANFLLGLIREIGTVNVKSWECEEVEDGYRYDWKWHIDDIVRAVNNHFSGNDYVQTLLLLQEELKGYEYCYFVSAFYRIDFNYVLFLKDKDAYKARLEEYIRKINENIKN